MMEALELEITELSEAEAAMIWKRQTKRAPNFDAYLSYLNTHKVGHSWNTRVPLDVADVPTAPADSKENATYKLPDGRVAVLRKRGNALVWLVVSLKMDEYVKTIRHNFNEAAKARTEWPAVDNLIPPAYLTGTAGAEYKLPDGRLAVYGANGWHAETPAPVIVRWKANTHKEKRNVVEAGKKREIEVTVTDSLEGLIVASESVQTRGPRAVTEDVTALVTSPPAGAKKGAKTDLADGRKATLTAAGKWRAPKLDTVNGAVVPNGATVPSTSNVSTGNNAVTPEAAAVV